MNGIGMSGLDDASLEAKVQRILGKAGPKLENLSSQAQKVAV